MSDINDIKARVIALVSEQLNVAKEKINENTSFINDLGADSLDTVELLMQLEDEFKTSIPESEAEKIQTIGDAIRFIQSQKKS